jgi:hypothetical protein
MLIDATLSAAETKTFLDGLGRLRKAAELLRPALDAGEDPTDAVETIGAETAKGFRNEDDAIVFRKDSFSLVHNALCTLRQVEKTISILSPRLREDLSKGILLIDEALETSRKDEEDEFDEKWKSFDRIRTERGFMAVWSIYEITDLLSEHSFGDGIERLSYEGFSAPVVGKRWIDLYEAADRVMRASGDEHHVFIEGFTPMTENPATLKMVTGS